MKPYYQRAGVTLYHGDARDVLPGLTERGIVIFDPPYSEHTHKASRIGASDSADGISRNVDLGFAHLSAADRRLLAREAHRLAARWVLVFSDTESGHLWRASLQARGDAEEEARIRHCEAEGKPVGKVPGLDFVRTGIWVKEGCTPQFSGDRPAIAVEEITICHPRGRKRWNGGGRHALWVVPIVQHGKANEPRLHTTQKPEALMLALVSDFSEPGEVVYDFTMGSGTTAIGCLRAPGGPRRFVGIEREEKWIEAAARRLDAELDGSTYYAAKAGQCALFGDESRAGARG